MSAELQRKNTEFLKRFRRRPRPEMPDYIAHQKNDGRPLEHEPTKPKKDSVKFVSLRAQIASQVRFSKELKMVSTNRQLQAYAYIKADQIISQRRKAKKQAAIA